MTSAPSKIAQLLGPVLEERGFVGDRLRFYRYEQESILLIDIQPARYSSGPYINLGIFYFKYGRQNKPDIVDCQVRTRLTSIVPDPGRGNDLLDPTNNISNDVRRDELQTMIRLYAVPWLESMAHLDAAKAVLANNPRAALVAPDARADLLPPK